MAAALVAGGWRRHRLLIATAVGTAAACTVSVIAGVVAVGAFWRFGIQEAIGIRIAIIMLAAVAVDLLLARRRPDPPQGSIATSVGSSRSVLDEGPDVPDQHVLDSLGRA